MLLSWAMKIAALLPHVEVYGGVRRYIEIGNELSRRGYEFVLFNPEGTSPSWLKFYGKTKPFADLTRQSFDVGLCSEYSILPAFKDLKAKVKYFYFVLGSHKMEKEVIQGDYHLLANSEGLSLRIRKKYKVPCLKVAGGVNTGLFRPEPRTKSAQEFRILCYGRIHKRRKGIRYVIRAVESLAKSFPQIKLVFFDSIVGKDRLDPRLLIQTSVPFEFHLDCSQEELAWIFSQSDLYVSAEWRAGWSNPSAEAMACGVPVVCTSSGTQDFAIHNRTALVVPLPFPFFLRKPIRKIIMDKDLRLRLSREGLKMIRKFKWPVLVDRLERIFQDSVKLK